MTKLIKQIEKLGYEVGIAAKINNITVYRVVGFGVDIQVNSNDQSSLKSLVNPKHHKERVKQHRQKK